MVGAACALELAARGASVTLVERDHLAAHASGRNQGLWVLPDDDVNVPMARASLAAYRSFAPDAPLDVGLDDEPVGTVVVALDAREAREAEELVTRARHHGIVVDDISGPADIRDTEPGLTRNVASAWLVHDGHRLDPGALTVAMALAAASRGAEIRHHLPARALAVRAGTVRGVVTDEGTIEAATTVVAAGPWSSALLDPVGVHLPIVGARGWLARIEPARPDLLEHLVVAAGPHAALRDVDGEHPRLPTAGELIADGTAPSVIGSLLHPHRDGRTITVGSTRQAWVTPEPPEERIVEQLLEIAVGLVPAVADASVHSAWWGVRPLTPDERPMIGAVREGLHVATGHGSEGVILGAGTAQLVAAQLAGEPAPFDPAIYEPLRFDASTPDDPEG